MALTSCGTEVPIPIPVPTPTPVEKSIDQSECEARCDPVPCADPELDGVWECDWSDCPDFPELGINCVPLR